MVNEVISAALIYAHAYRSLHQSLNQVLMPYNLTLLEWSFLGVINDHPQLTMKDAADLMKFDASHITQLAQALKQQDLIAFQNNKADKRSKSLTLTPQGVEQVQLATQNITRETTRILAGLTPVQIKAHLEVLNHIIQQTS